MYLRSAFALEKHNRAEESTVSANMAPRITSTTNQEEMMQVFCHTEVRRFSRDTSNSRSMCYLKHPSSISVIYMNAVMSSVILHTKICFQCSSNQKEKGKNLRHTCASVGSGLKSTSGICTEHQRKLGLMESQMMTQHLEGTC